MKIISVVGARPNFMKVAPIHRALQQYSQVQSLILHTGQHYDVNMSDVFFRDLRLPEPVFHLNVGSGSHAEQTGGVMIAYEKVCMENRPDVIVVVGDVNSTVACALVGAKLHIPVVHLEAGLRSGDRRMPEEINRLVTDAIADLLGESPVYAYSFRGERYDCGSKLGYLKATVAYGLEHPGTGAAFREHLKEVLTD